MAREAKGRRPTEAERRLFREAMAGASPLGEEPPAASAPPAKPRAAVPPPATAPVLAPGAAAGVDARTVLRLRRGQIRPEARLDLHGLTLAEAHAALARFIEAGAARGHRCVIVITGKGRVGEDAATIRRELPHWLNLQPTRGRVLAFAGAQPKDGGAGAWYVLLRRARPAKG